MPRWNINMFDSSACRQGVHIDNAIVAINHKEDFPKAIEEEVKIFRTYLPNTKFDVCTEVITNYESYCFGLANQGKEFNLPSIAKFKIKEGTRLWEVIQQKFAEEQGYECWDDVPQDIIDANYERLSKEMKQTFFDNKLAKKLTIKEAKRAELLIKRGEGM